MNRRHWLGAASACAAAWPLAGRAQSTDPADAAARAAPLPFAAPPRPARMRVSADRIVDITVCTRPFRAQGPRIEAQRLHGKTVIHHYGHGGAGWSLSWGSATLGALPLIRATGARRIAVIGCGAIGLTTARVAQRAGLKVRIYCRERPPEVASTFATGMWSPESRIVTADHATPAFNAMWEGMARHSFRAWQDLLGLTGSPVEWRDGYVLSDTPFDQPLPYANAHGSSTEPDYPDLLDRIPDLHPRSRALAPSEHPFPVPHARRFTQMTFNIRPYQRLLLEDFFREGGEIVTRDFAHARELAALPERTIVNCTGYGARALFGDDSLIPVRGQIARLVPQPEVDYMVAWRGHNLMVVPRRDGLLVQAQGEHDFNNPDRGIDRAMSEAAVARLATLFE
ncbi:FAD-dependent oxidoreductase [Mitsuaria sp. GD03876]|uniref:NAD(P)/FAD-dependent oxidoreductase n=1 Tax=Mitsuaria sp. GD03876 TaxID=2975399 RepID=UPI00244C0026|nr:FAD-dependent oxidoreductase [Mitsuaria sp. GD03876]MDH0866129.1 FAD-binding oxidoreductase [Mitsuaria sp. GD03876]